jgi:hypothetical protein
MIPCATGGTVYSVVLFYALCNRWDSIQYIRFIVYCIQICVYWLYPEGKEMSDKTRNEWQNRLRTVYPEGKEMSDKMRNE